MCVNLPQSRPGRGNNCIGFNIPTQRKPCYKKALRYWNHCGTNGTLVNNNNITGQQIHGMEDKTQGEQLFNVQLLYHTSYIFK